MEFDNSHRDFGFCKILWKIEHFCLSTCKRNWIISSPEFSVRGAYLTTWKIILKQNEKANVEDDCMISACLHRLDNDAGPDEVRANWEIHFLNGRKNDCNFIHTEQLFRKNTCYEKDLENMNDLLNEFQPFETDVLYVQCHLIVSFNNCVKINICSEQGIRTLSSDLSKLYFTGAACDVTLKVRDKCILAHKAVLYARNSTLASIFDSKPEIKLIDLTPSGFDLLRGKFVNADAISKILVYLYSGNLEFVTDEPTISIYECAVMFGVNELIQCYTPDEINVQSSIDAEESVISWIIKDFEAINEDCILSPCLINTASEIVWRLHLFTKGQENFEEYVSVYAEIFQGMKRKHICLEFAIVDVNQEFSNPKRVLKSIRSGGLLGFADFIKRECLHPLLKDGTLRIVSKLRVFNDVTASSCSIECSSISLVKEVTKEETLELLSEHMSYLFKEGKFSDAKIYCGNRVFNVHKCILATRSDVLSETLCEKLKSTPSICVSNFEPDMLNILLMYVYSGTAAEFSYDVMCEVYREAEKFNMYGLMNKFLQIHNSIERR